MRALTAVAAGIAVMLLTRFVPNDNLAVSIGSTIGLAILAGFVTALVAGRNEFRYVGMLGAGVVGIAVFTMRSRGAVQPGWNEIAMGGCGPMAGFLGAALRLLTKPAVSLD